MTREETKKLMAVIRAAWPNFYKDIDKSTLSAALNIWSIALADLEEEKVNAGLIELVKTLKFPPTVAELRESTKSVEINRKWMLRVRRDMESLHAKYGGEQIGKPEQGALADGEGDTSISIGTHYAEAERIDFSNTGPRTKA